MPKTEHGDKWGVAAMTPVYIVLCRDGAPHNGGVPVFCDHAVAETSAQAIDIGESPSCGPHRVQAYRPMR